MSDAPDTSDTPFALLGGEPRVRRLVGRFYEIMARDEPALARLHACDDQGRVVPDSQEKLVLYLIGWLGGPQDYVARYGHPRLRMRHAHVPIDIAMRDAWVRTMRAAMDAESIAPPLREFMDSKLGDLADHMRNRAG